MNKDAPRRHSSLLRNPITAAAPTHQIPIRPNKPMSHSKYEKYRYFRCVTCGFNGEITMEEIARHRESCPTGTTYGEPEICPDCGFSVVACQCEWEENRDEDEETF